MNLEERGALCKNSRPKTEDPFAGTAQEWVEKSIALVQLDEKLAPVEEVLIDADSAKLKLIISGVLINSTTLQFGVETDGKALDGRPVKVSINGAGMDCRSRGRGLESGLCPYQSKAICHACLLHPWKGI